MIAQGRLPELENMFAIPNGGWFKNKAIGMKMKQEGLRKGVPDIFLPGKNAQFNGLFIEMKFGNNGLTSEQKTWIDRLGRAGFQTAICRDWVEAAMLICIYFEKGKKEFPEIFNA